MVYITRITERLGLTKPGTLKRLTGLLESFNLPVALPDVNMKDLVGAIRIDKKSRSGLITIAYLRETGKCGLAKWSFEDLEEHLFAQLEN